VKTEVELAAKQFHMWNYEMADSKTKKEYHASVDLPQIRSLRLRTGGRANMDVVCGREQDHYSVRRPRLRLRKDQDFVFSQAGSRK